MMMNRTQRVMGNMICSSLGAKEDKGKESFPQRINGDECEALSMFTAPSIYVFMQESK